MRLVELVLLIGVRGLSTCPDLIYLGVANRSQYGRWRLSDDELSPQLA
jgi:hypothetical protein